MVSIFVLVLVLRKPLSNPFLQLTPTINFMMNWFNTCSYGIAASLIKIPSADKRALALNRIIEAASECERVFSSFLLKVFVSLKE